MTPQNSDRSTARRRWPTATLAGAALIALAACGGDDGGNGIERRTATYGASLASFPSCDALDDYLVDLATDSLVDAYVYGYGYYDAVAGGRGGMEGDDVGAPTAGGDGGEGPTDFTGTNVQELGVDEPDMMKTDGQTLYVVSGQTLHVIDAWPAEEAHELAAVPLTGWGDQMFLEGDRLVVFTHVYTGEERWGGGAEPTPDRGVPEEPTDVEEPDGGTPPEPDPFDDGTWFSGTRVTVFDVSDPAEPSVATMFDIEGNYVSARLVDGVVYMISNSDLFGIYDADLDEAARDIVLPELSYDSTEEEREAAAATLREQVRPLVAAYVAERGRDALIPDLRTSATERANLFECRHLMYPEARAGFGLLSVIAFDPASPDPSGVGLLASGWQIYGSASSLYVAQDSRWWYWTGPEDTFTATHIHKFDLNAGNPTYRASGQVDGWLLNQFSMSEYDGHLRVATTDQSNFGFWGGPAVDGGVVDVDAPPGGTDAGSGSTDGGSASTDAGSAEPIPSDKTVVDLREGTDEADVDANNVFVLRQNGGSLDVVGGIRGIAPTERIYAVRFVGERGYVVTFRQTDPLFTVDLSDPENPALVGELHIPGYSGYLHPFGDGHLIGIGRNGTEDGRILGLQISVFDVSDPASPTRTAQHEIAYGDTGWSWSEAEHDHHAFTFYEREGLLAIPVTLEDWSREDGAYSHFSGVIVFDVDGDSIAERGRVSHSGMAHDEYCERLGEGADCSGWDYEWWVQMRRSYFADEYLYAISDRGVTASSIDAIGEVLAEVRY